MKSLYNTLREGVKETVHQVRCLIKPYVVVYDNNKNVLVAGHHRTSAPYLIETLNFCECSGMMLVGRRQFKKIQGEIRRSGDCNLATVLD